MSFFIDYWLLDWKSDCEGDWHQEHGTYNLSDCSGIKCPGKQMYESSVDSSSLEFVEICPGPPLEGQGLIGPFT